MARVGSRAPVSSFYEDIWTRKTRGAAEGQSSREVHALPFVPKGSRLLDVGCGIGQMLASAPSPRMAVGVDLAEAALSAARRRGLAVALADLEGAHLPFRDASFDRVTCLGVIEHLFDPRPVMSEARRVLTPGGLFIVLTPNVRHLYQIVRLLLHGHGPKTSGDPEGIDGGHIHYFAPRDVKELLMGIGFDAVELRGTGGVNWLASFRCPDILAIARKGT